MTEAAQDLPTTSSGPTLWMATANDRKLLRCVLPAAGLTDDVLVAHEASGFGSALFAAGGEVLQVKRPVEAGAALGPLLGPEVRAVRQVGCLVRSDSGTPPRSETVPPFRHKGWVMAMTGDVPPLPQVPEGSEEHALLQRNLRAHTGPEAVAHLIISRVYRSASQRALSAAALVEMVNGVLRPLESASFGRWVAVLTSETIGVVINRGGAVHFRTVERVRRCVQCSPDGARDFDGVNHPHLRGAAVVSGEASYMPPGPGWRVLGANEALVLENDAPAKRIDG